MGQVDIHDDGDAVNCAFRKEDARPPVRAVAQGDTTGVEVVLWGFVSLSATPWQTAWSLKCLTANKMQSRQCHTGI